MKDHFQMLAAYDCGGNALIFSFIARVGEADCQKRMGACFGSINRALSHVPVTDQVGPVRFAGEAEPP